MILSARSGESMSQCRSLLGRPIDRIRNLLHAYIRSTSGRIHDGESQLLTEHARTVKYGRRRGQNRKTENRIRRAGHRRKSLLLDPSSIMIIIILLSRTRRRYTGRVVTASLHRGSA